MNFLRKVVANINTGVLAHWYSLTETEFNKIKQENNSINNPSGRLSVELNYWYNNFNLMTNTKNKTYHLVYFSKLENINPDQVLLLIEEYRQTGGVHFSEKSISESNKYSAEKKHLESKYNDLVIAIRGYLEDSKTFDFEPSDLRHMQDKANVLMAKIKEYE